MVKIMSSIVNNGHCIEIIKFFINGKTLIGLKCPDLHTSIISVDHCDMVRMEAGTCNRFGNVVSKGWVMISGDPDSHPALRPIEMEALQGIDILVGLDLLPD
jgi:hypothetical protein